ncbi:hypothetical protein N9Z67_01185 [Rhodopirellula sp.]|nr:hypothetical protein [Rhodopirellula sp.]
MHKESNRQQFPLDHFNPSLQLTHNEICLNGIDWLGIVLRVILVNVVIEFFLNRFVIGKGQTFSIGSTTPFRATQRQTQSAASGQVYPCLAK